MTVAATLQYLTEYIERLFFSGHILINVGCLWSHDLTDIYLTVQCVVAFT